MAPPGTVCAQVRSASASPSARGRTVWPAQASARDALQAVSDAALRSVTYPARLGSAEAQRRGTHTARGLRGRGGGSRGGASTRVRRDGARGLSVRTHASRESPQRSVRVRRRIPADAQRVQREAPLLARDGVSHWAPRVGVHASPGAPLPLDCTNRARPAWCCPTIFDPCARAKNPEDSLRRGSACVRRAERRLTPRLGPACGTAPRRRGRAHPQARRAACLLGSAVSVLGGVGLLKRK